MNEYVSTLRAMTVNQLCAEGNAQRAAGDTQRLQAVENEMDRRINAPIPTVSRQLTGR